MLGAPGGSDEVRPGWTLTPSGADGEGGTLGMRPPKRCQAPQGRLRPQPVLLFNHDFRRDEVWRVGYPPDWCQTQSKNLRFGSPIYVANFWDTTLGIGPINAAQGLQQDIAKTRQPPYSIVAISVAKPIHVSLSSIRTQL